MLRGKSYITKNSRSGRKWLWRPEASELWVTESLWQYLLLSWFRNTRLYASLSSWLLFHRHSTRQQCFWARPWWPVYKVTQSKDQHIISLSSVWPWEETSVISQVSGGRQVGEGQWGEGSRWVGGVGGDSCWRQNGSSYTHETCSLCKSGGGKEVSFSIQASQLACSYCWSPTG